MTVPASPKHLVALLADNLFRLRNSSLSGLVCRDEHIGADERMGFHFAINFLADFSAKAKLSAIRHGRWRDDKTIMHFRWHSRWFADAAAK